MEQGRHDQLLDYRSLRKLIEIDGAEEDRPCGLMRARFSRLFADFLTRLGLSDFPAA